MNGKVSEIIRYILVLIIIAASISVCYTSIRLSTELGAVQKSIEDCRNTTAELGKRINDQKQYIDQLEQVSRQLESSIARTADLYRELESIESNVDGYTGAVRGTIDNISRTLDVTIQAIEQEGIDN